MEINYLVLEVLNELLFLGNDCCIALFGLKHSTLHCTQRFFLFSPLNDSPKLYLAFKNVIIDTWLFKILFLKGKKKTLGHFTEFDWKHLCWGSVSSWQMEITQVYSTRRSIRYSTRGRGRALSFPLLPGIESVDSCLLPPAPKKKTRTLYSTGEGKRLCVLTFDCYANYCPVICVCVH